MAGRVALRFARNDFDDSTIILAQAVMHRQPKNRTTILPYSTRMDKARSDGVELLQSHTGASDRIAGTSSPAKLKAAGCRMNLRNRYSDAHLSKCVLTVRRWSARLSGQVGRLIKRGKRQDVAEMHLYDGDGRLVGHATGTFIPLPGVTLG